MKNALLLSAFTVSLAACHPSQPWTLTVNAEDTTVENLQLVVELTYLEGAEDLGDGTFLFELVDGTSTIGGPTKLFLTNACSIEPQGIARVSRGFQEPELGTVPWDITSSFDGDCAVRPIVMEFEIPATMTAEAPPAG